MTSRRADHVHCWHFYYAEEHGRVDVIESITKAGICCDCGDERAQTVLTVDAAKENS